MKQINVCVLEYLESGDQASVWFVDYTSLSQVPNSDCAAYAAAIKTALRSKDKMTSMPYDQAFCNGAAYWKKHQLKLPCQIDKSITIYLD